MGADIDPAEGVEGGFDGGELGGENTGEDEESAGFHPGNEAIGFTDEEIMHQVGADHVETGWGTSGQTGDIGDGPLNATRHLVDFGVFRGGPDAIGIEVESVDWRIAEGDGAEGEDAGAGAGIEEGLGLGGIAEADDFGEAEPGGGMLTGTEAEAGIEEDDGLAGEGFAAVPGGFDEQLASDDDRFEMALPGLRPVACGNLADADGSRGGIESGFDDGAESVAQVASEGGDVGIGQGQEGGDGDDAGMDVGMDAWGDSGDTFDEGVDGVFGLVVGDDGDLAEDGIHRSRHGVKLRRVISVRGRPALSSPTSMRVTLA